MYKISVHEKTGNLLFLNDADSVELDEMLGGILRIKKQGAMFCVPLSNISHYVITDQEAKQCEDGTNPALSVKVSPLPSKRGYSG